MSVQAAVIRILSDFPFQLIAGPGRKSCVKGDKLQSRKWEQNEGLPILGTAQVNLAYPPMFRDGRRYARAARMPSFIPETLRSSRVQAIWRSWNMSRS